jgi:anti-anti-sigma regulatory factor
MKLTLLPLGTDALIRVQCEGHLTSPHLAGDGDPLEKLLGPHCHGHKVLLNLERVRSIDTGGVCWLLHQDKLFRQQQGKFILYLMPPLVRDVLDVLRLGPMLQIAADEPAACSLAAAQDEPAAERFGRREATPRDSTLRRPG